MTSTTPTQHAKYSPSGASRWMQCPGSVPLSASVPNTSSAYADEGTAAHELAAWCLEDNRKPEDFLMYELHIYDGHCCTDKSNKSTAPEAFGTHTMWTVDDDMVGHVQKYLDEVRAHANVKDAKLLVEQKIDFSYWVGDSDQFGTADAVVTSPDELTIIDLKYGRGVQVDAFYVDEESGETKPNKQLAIYALGAYSRFNLIQEFKSVRLVIVQPRLHHVSEFTMSVEELLSFGEQVKEKAAEVYRAELAASKDEDMKPFCHPSKEACRWCKVPQTTQGCPALDTHVMAVVTDGDFEDMTSIPEIDVSPQDAAPDRLSYFMKQVELVETWCTGVRAAVFAKLNAGEAVGGFKLVRGRKGTKRWLDESQAEKVLTKSMKLRQDEAYTRKLITPTQALKLLKDSPIRTKRIEGMIEQKDGALHVAPSSDKRDAVIIDLGLGNIKDISAESLL